MLDGHEGRLEVRGLCEEPEAAALRFLAAGGVPLDEAGPGAVAALGRVVSRLRDHLRLHARPVAVSFFIQDPASDENVQHLAVAEIEIGDSPVAAAARFGEQNGLGPSDVADVAQALKEATQPFDYDLICSPSSASSL